jgi:hypothetical protein
LGDRKEVATVGSKPVQLIISLPPVQAENSSLEIWTMSPMMGLGGFRGAGNGGPVPPAVIANGLVPELVADYALSWINGVVLENLLLEAYLESLV